MQRTPFNCSPGSLLDLDFPRSWSQNNAALPLWKAVIHGYLWFLANHSSPLESSAVKIRFIPGKTHIYPLSPGHTGRVRVRVFALRLILHLVNSIVVTTPRMRFHGRTRDASHLGNAKQPRNADAISVWPGHNHASEERFRPLQLLRTSESKSENQGAFRLCSLLFWLFQGTTLGPDASGICLFVWAWCLDQQSPFLQTKNTIQKKKCLRKPLSSFLFPQPNAERQVMTFYRAPIYTGGYGEWVLYVTYCCSQLQTPRQFTKQLLLMHMRQDKAPPPSS